MNTIQDIKHQAILDALRADIESGALRVGERLPTSRALAAELGLAVGTVARAYRDAAASGLIQSEVGRGTHVLGPASHRSAESGFGARLDGLIDLSIDFPLEQLDPDPARVLNRLAHDPHRMDLMRYIASEGSPRARAAGLEWATRYGLVGRTPGDVIVCAGSQHALVVSLASVFDGRRGQLFAEALTYPGFQSAARLLGLKPEPIDIDEEGLVPDALEEACRGLSFDIPSALYIVPSLHNPTTVAMSAKRREALAQVIERYGLFVIEDDVHRLHADEPAMPIATLAPQRTFFIAGISKVVSAGIRIAYLFPPRDLLNDAARHVLATQWSVPPLTAEIIAQWIEDGTADTVRKAKASEATERQRIASEILGNFDGLRSQTQSFYLWLELPDAWTGDAFALALARRGVGVLSDSSFRIDAGAPDRRGVRICLGAANSQEELRTALASVASVLKLTPGDSQRVV